MKREYDVIVVGAGPAGSIAAKFAAEKGVSVLMLEKDRDVGYPVRCGEAANRAGIEEFITPDPRWINAYIEKVLIIAPDKSEVLMDFAPKAFILERRIFDYELAKQASKAGAEVLTRAYVNGLLFEDGSVSGVRYQYCGEQKEVKAKVVIGADGVESRVGRWAGLKTYTDFRDMGCCVQVTAANVKVETDTFCYCFGQEVAPFGYFWVFPKGDNIANIGIGVSGIVGKKRSASSYLNEMLEKNYPDASILSTVSGGVPSTKILEKISAPGLMLAGDAARQVNPLTGGGIVSGMRAGRLAGKIAAEAVLTNKPELILSYDSQWHDCQGKKHEIFNRLKEGIINFSDKQFNDLAHAIIKLPYEKRTLGNLLRTAVFNKPSLVLDVAKVFLT